MSNLTLSYLPSDLDTLNISVSGSKSISQRVLIINYLMGIDTKILNLSNSFDTEILSNCLSSSELNLNVYNSGTSLRFLISLFAFKNKEVTLIGDDYLFQRPIQLLIDSLNKLGGNIIRNRSSISVLKGNLTGGDLYFKSMKTSQFVSSILLIAPYLRGGLKLHLSENNYSESYIDMTLSIMKECGINFLRKQKSIFVPSTGYTKFYNSIESDWTSASYLFSSFLFSKLKLMTISKFDPVSIQPDSDLINFFILLGVRTSFDDNKIILKKDVEFPTPKKIKWNFKNNPDLCLTILTTCLGLGIDLEATGVETLKYKESDRIQSMKNELLKFNSKLVIKSPDEFFLKVNRSIQKDKLITIDTYNDHRIALSFSILVFLGLKLKINNSDVINKSYPDFFTDLIKFGVLIQK